MENKNIITMFVEGARKGWEIAINNLMPNVIFAFAIIKILEVTGAMQLIGEVCTPIMTLFGLPGEAIIVNITALLSMGGATGVLIGLLSNGQVGIRDASVLLPAIFVCGGQIQNIGRILGTSGVCTKHYTMLFGVTILNGILAMAIMCIILKFFY